MRRRAPRKKARIVGLYRLPYTPDLYALELILPVSGWCDFSQFHGYEPPATVGWGVGMAHFYLSEDGEELIGSYLDYQGPEGDERWQAEIRKRPPHHDREPILRVVMLVDCFASPAYFTPWGTLEFPEATAIPDRLLRLIWVDEGTLPQGACAAYLDEL